MAQAHEQIKTLAQPEPPVNFTMSAIPFEVWKAVMNEATNRRVAAKQIWIEAAIQYLGLEKEAAGASEANSPQQNNSKSAQSPAA